MKALFLVVSLAVITLGRAGELVDWEPWETELSPTAKEPFFRHHAGIQQQSGSDPILMFEVQNVGSQTMKVIIILVNEDDADQNIEWEPFMLAPAQYRVARHSFLKGRWHWEFDLDVLPTGRR